MWHSQGRARSTRLLPERSILTRSPGVGRRGWPIPVDVGRLAPGEVSRLREVRTVLVVVLLAVAVLVASCTSDEDKLGQLAEDTCTAYQNNVGGRTAVQAATSRVLDEAEELGFTTDELVEALETECPTTMLVVYQLLSGAVGG